MFSTCRKIWLDTTTYQGRYVAKDVHKTLAFLGGFVLLIGHAVWELINKTPTMEPATALLIFSLGGTALKEHYKYKNNAVAADCPGGDESPNAEPLGPAPSPDAA